MKTAQQHSVQDSGLRREAGHAAGGNSTERTLTRLLLGGVKQIDQSSPLPCSLGGWLVGGGGLGQLGPVEGVSGWPACTAGESSATHRLDMRRNFNQTTVGDSVLQPGVNTGRLDVKKSGCGGDTAQQFDDLRVGHG